MLTSSKVARIRNTNQKNKGKPLKMSSKRLSFQGARGFAKTCKCKVFTQAEIEQYKIEKGL